MPDAQKSRKRRRIFVEHYGEGPYNCFFCASEVKVYDIHHIDGDHDNDTSENMAAAHPTCHRSHHSKGNKYRVGKKLTKEHKMAIRKTAITMRRSPNGRFLEKGVTS